MVQAQMRRMLIATWVLVIALSFHFFPEVAGQVDGADQVSGMLNSRGVEDALKLVEKSLEETLERMKDSLGADLQHVLAEIIKRGEDFGDEVMYITLDIIIQYMAYRWTS